MTKPNYAAWQIDANNFSDTWPDSEKLAFFARYAVLAPSGHNTQPWLLHPHKESLYVSIHPNHHLSIDGSGLLSVEPYISIGTFLEVFRLAAEGFGYELTIKLFPKEDKVAELSIGRRITPHPQLLGAIVKRVSNRNPYEQTPIPSTKLNAFLGEQLTGVGTTLVTKRPDIDFMAEQTAVGIKSIMAEPLYRLELSKWVRTNQTRKFDGMPGFTHGFGNVQSLVSRVAVRHAPKHGPQAKKSHNLVQDSGALVIVRCQDDEKTSFINAGRLYSRVCVLAADAGLSTSALGASVLAPISREQVKKHFGFDDRPIYVLRIGKATKESANSPRWPVEKLFTRADA